jgi:hypothetical protein
LRGPLKVGERIAEGYRRIPLAQPDEWGDPRVTSDVATQVLAVPATRTVRCGALAVAAFLQRPCVTRSRQRGRRAAGAELARAGTRVRGWRIVSR